MTKTIFTKSHNFCQCGTILNQHFCFISGSIGDKRIQWSTRMDNNIKVPIEYDGIPYIYIGFKVYECHHGKDWKEAYKVKKREKRIQTVSVPGGGDRCCCIAIVLIELSAFSCVPLFLPRYSPENGIRVCAALKTHFSRPPGHSLRPHFIIFSVPQGPKFTWNHKFLENLHFKASKLGKSSVLKGVLHLWALFLKTLCIFSKNKATSDKVSYGSGQKCSKELENYSFTSVETIVVKLQWKMCENQYFPCFEP